MKVGVLALQGAVSEHIEALKKAIKELNVDWNIVYVRTVKDLDDISGLVIPGGESTTISRLMIKTGLHEKIIKQAKKGLPILGTCAGTILLAKEGDEQIKQTNTILLGLMNMKVKRNVYGRQVDSFETDVSIPDIGKKPFRAIFIRAPSIEKVWNKTKVFAKYRDSIIGAKKENMLALTFHPELTNDLRIHQYFLKIIRQNQEKSI
ncbi:MAG: pyridoxal 5'-phosphate synthase glutaminase subunit PdxT [Candidatus Heimdallarchaeaceae archaeon]